jgi:hypothetical protein
VFLLAFVEMFTISFGFFIASTFQLCSFNIFFLLFALFFFFFFFGKTRLCDKDFILAAQEAEAANPLSLAELFRLSLCFVDEELAEDPQPGTPLQMPHLKGLAIEEMLITVYRRYCRYSRSLQFNTIQNNTVHWLQEPKKWWFLYFY